MFTSIDSSQSTLPNGVASGDTTQTSTVLWTRSTAKGTVFFEYSIHPNFCTILGTASGLVTDSNQPVKVELTNLKPRTTYYYRVTDAAGTCAGGQFRTAAELGTPAGLRFGVAGDWHGDLAPYPAIANVPERQLEFFVAHGDTAYADLKTPDLDRPASTLDEFRIKFNEVYSARLGLNTWADLRASTSILATIDDHEVDDNFAGGAPASSHRNGRFGTGSELINNTELFKNALQAFQEYHPLRDEFYGETREERTTNKRKLYRYNTYGSDAAVFILDTRSFRDANLPLSFNPTKEQEKEFLTRSFEPNRTLLGQKQLTDLQRDLLDAQNNCITWKFILIPEPIQNLGIPVANDRYEGFAAERTQLLRFIKENCINNVVFISADFHGTAVNNLTYQESADGVQIPVDAFDIMTSPVAFYEPFGPTSVRFSSLTSEEKAAYEALPTIHEKDEFVKNLVDARLIPFGYNPLGLEGSGIDTTLLKGSYVAAHVYGWTEFEVDASTQQLRVITYGIEPYSLEQLTANPSTIISRTPIIISEFIVNSKN
ncbi:alkaline phosphatase D family protein [Trichocoleus sp. DQ-A3]|uniref:alkaline phosphatase D family protein n=1 Tax=Cyanophyceae TaxID=3028117 RepID=UPI0016882B8E|nr:alkaline phosphatase D family protein [Coleofasciculus sp. FACHB-125]MBD1903039.1 alkaline phosphatase D family protein [Coleofasciculus sp. FACHB-125]